MKRQNRGQFANKKNENMTVFIMKAVKVLIHIVIRRLNKCKFAFIVNQVHGT